RGALLSDPAQGLGAGVEGLEEHRVIARVRRSWPDVEYELGDHREGSLRPQDRFAEVRSGSRRRKRRQGDLRRGSRSPQAEHQVVEPTVTSRRLTGRPRRGAAADRDVLEALWEVAER